MKTELRNRTLSVIAFLLFWGSVNAQIIVAGIQINATNGITYQKIGNITLTEIIGSL